MNMSKSIHFFSNKESLKSNIDKTILGIRGRQLNEFSELGLPIVPGLVMDATITQSLQQTNVVPLLKPFLKESYLLYYANKLFSLFILDVTLYLW